MPNEEIVLLVLCENSFLSYMGSHLREARKQFGSDCLEPSFTCNEVYLRYLVELS